MSTADPSFDPYWKWLGISPKDQPPHHYRLLGTELFESDAEVITNAADQRMLIVKNFQAGKYSEASQKILNEIAAARVCLLNTEKKQSTTGSWPTGCNSTSHPTRPNRLPTLREPLRRNCRT